MSKRPAKKSSEAASSEGKASDQARDKAVEAVLLFLKTTAPYEAASPRSKRELTMSRAIHSCLRLAIHTPASPQAPPRVLQLVLQGGDERGAGGVLRDQAADQALPARLPPDASTACCSRTEKLCARGVTCLSTFRRSRHGDEKRDHHDACICIAEA